MRSDPRVAWVNYSGFPESPHYPLRPGVSRRNRQLNSYVWRTGRLRGRKSVPGRAQAFQAAVKSGRCKISGVHPASTIHGRCLAEVQAKAGVRPETISLSVGIEHYERHHRNLDQALRRFRHRAISRHWSSGRDNGGRNEALSRESIGIARTAAEPGAGTASVLPSASSTTCPMARCGRRGDVTAIAEGCSTPPADPSSVDVKADVVARTCRAPKLRADVPANLSPSGGGHNVRTGESMADRNRCRAAGPTPRRRALLARLARNWSNGRGANTVRPSVVPCRPWPRCIFDGITGARWGQVDRPATNAKTARPSLVAGRPGPFNVPHSRLQRTCELKS